MSNERNRQYKTHGLTMDGNAVKDLVKVLTGSDWYGDRDWPQKAWKIIDLVRLKCVPRDLFVQNCVVPNVVYFYILYSIFFHANLRSLDLIQI